MGTCDLMLIDSENEELNIKEHRRATRIISCNKKH